MGLTSPRLPALLGAAALALGTTSSPAAAASDSCREWQGEHRQWKTEVVRRYLHGAPDGAVDEALFELIQREAYLTACDVPVQTARSELIGWRLVGRAPDEFGSAVLESVLEQSGLVSDLRRLFGGDLAAPSLSAAAETDPLR